MPEKTLLSIEVEKQAIVIGSTERDEAIFNVDKKDDEDYELHPDIYFFSSGEIQNFRISIADEDSPNNQYLITGNMLGQIRYLRPDQDENR